jgi:hypothetical protein
MEGDTFRVPRCTALRFLQPGACARLVCAARGGRLPPGVNVCARAALPAPLCAPALQRRAHPAPCSRPPGSTKTQLSPPVPFLAPPAPAPALHMKVPLAGADAAGNPTETLLSEVGLVLLRFFNTREACTLRLVCREFVEAVRVQQWEDRDTVITGSVAAWRACFSRARCANVRIFDHHYGGRATSVVDADFIHLEGLRELNMAGCEAVTDAAFVHLHGIHTLDMFNCDQPTITDAAFAHLAGIQRLSIYGCKQATLTDAAFVHLRGIQVLNLCNCKQLSCLCAPAGHSHALYALLQQGSHY